MVVPGSPGVAGQLHTGVRRALSKAPRAQTLPRVKPQPSGPWGNGQEDMGAVCEVALPWVGFPGLRSDMHFLGEPKKLQLRLGKCPRRLFSGAMKRWCSHPIGWPPLDVS